jgi:hypothetical protein
MPRLDYASLLATALALVLAQCLSPSRALAQEPPVQEAVPQEARQQVATPPTAAQLARWIEELAADKFIVREDATLALVEAGLAAVEPLAKALPRADLETATRGIHVLRELALSGDDGAEDAARGALEALAAGDSRSASSQAAGTLARLDEIRQQRAIDSLERLGAEVGYSLQAQVGLRIESDVTSVRIGPSFRGTDKDLAQLRWLGNVQSLTLEGERITDDSLRGLAGMKSLVGLSLKRAKITHQALAGVGELEQLRVVEVFYSPVGDEALGLLKQLKNPDLVKLYGTKMSKQTVEELQLALPGAKVDARSGGFLGVGCQAHPLGCGVSIVHPGSAADKAGIQPGDVITRYEDRKVQDFEELTQLIGQNVPDDTVTLQIWREGETFTKEVKLGEWE